RCPGYPACRRLRGRSAAPDRASAAWSCRRAESADNRAARAWSRTGNSSGRDRMRAELARGRQQIAKLDRSVALDAGHRRFAERVAVGKIVDHGFAETAFIVEHVMRNADPLGDVAGVVDV